MARSALAHRTPTRFNFSPDFGATTISLRLPRATACRFRPSCRSTCMFRFCANPCFLTVAATGSYTRSVTAGDRFLESLELELDLIAPQVDSDRLARQIHLGGGNADLSPNHEPAQTPDRVVAVPFRLAPDAEMGGWRSTRARIDPTRYPAAARAGLQPAVDRDSGSRAPTCRRQCNRGP